LLAKKSVLKLLSTKNNRLFPRTQQIEICTKMAINLQLCTRKVFANNQAKKVQFELEQRGEAREFVGGWLIVCFWELGNG
jgi:hypothetical protein